MPVDVDDVALAELLAFERAILADAATLIAVTEAYLDAITRLADAAGAMVREAFLDLVHLNRSNIDEFISASSPVLRAARAEAIDIATAYISEVSGVRPALADLREFAPAYDEPFKRTWHDLKVGMPWEEARLGGASQADALGQEVARRAATERTSKPGVKVRGWRRVVHANSCEWCQVVATQLYRTAESAEFGHHHCQCYPALPVTERGDPGYAINKERLAELKKSGAVQRATDARTRSRARAAGT